MEESLLFRDNHPNQRHKTSPTTFLCFANWIPRRYRLSSTPWRLLRLAICWTQILCHRLMCFWLNIGDKKLFGRFESLINREKCQRVSEIMFFVTSTASAKFLCQIGDIYNSTNELLLRRSSFNDETFLGIASLKTSVGDDIAIGFSSSFRCGKLL